MDTLTIDVRGLPSEKIQEIKQKIELWKQENQLASVSTPIKKRKVGPSDFIVRDSKLKAPLARALAYEG